MNIFRGYWTEMKSLFYWQVKKNVPRSLASNSHSNNTVLYKVMSVHSRTSPGSHMKGHKKWKKGKCEGLWGPVNRDTKSQRNRDTKTHERTWSPHNRSWKVLDPGHCAALKSLRPVNQVSKSPEGPWCGLQGAFTRPQAAFMRPQAAFMRPQAAPPTGDLPKPEILFSNLNLQTPGVYIVSHQDAFVNPGKLFSSILH